MPILFIHGVNNRKSDEDYFRSMAARNKLFEKIVVAVAKSKFPDFKVVEDAYWGDLGVQFRWGLASIPDSGLQALGAPDVGGIAGDNTELLSLLARVEPNATDLQILGDDDLARIRSIADKQPGDLVRAVYAPQLLSYEPTQSNQGTDVAKNRQEALQQEGEELALLMLAAERVARKVEADASLIVPPSGKTVLDQIGERTREELKGLAPPEQETDIQGLGVKEVFEWAGSKISGLVDLAKGTAEKVKNTTERGASLLLLQAKRDDVSRKSLRFLGDVFIYLHCGRVTARSIIARVVGAVTDAAITASANKEPLVVVTHSFGSEIFYDSLTSGRLDGIAVDLWVTVGAQTSLFAEMALFEKSSQAPALPHPKPLGKPSQVTRWINFYDAADVLSYLHEPIFGKDAVTDISVRDGANVTNAHGHYFLTISFYERIAQELQTIIAARSV